MNGYLLDDKGNVVNNQGKVIWKSYELMFNEPPKIFEFTQFWSGWVKGHCERDEEGLPISNFGVDNLGRKINALGYLVDGKMNIIDIYSGNIIFRREVLKKVRGEEA